VTVDEIVRMTNAVVRGCVPPPRGDEKIRKKIRDTPLEFPVELAWVSSITSEGASQRPVAGAQAPATRTKPV